MHSLDLLRNEFRANSGGGNRHNARQRCSMSREMEGLIQAPI